MKNKRVLIVYILFFFCLSINGLQIGDNEVSNQPVDVGNMYYSESYGQRLTGPHRGVDIVGPTANSILCDNVYSVEDGTVLYAGNSTTLGNHVIVDHSNGYATMYAHLNNTSVSTGDGVNGGTLIGHAGNTGQSSGAHLHYELREYEGSLESRNDFFNNATAVHPGDLEAEGYQERTGGGTGGEDDDWDITNDADYYPDGQGTANNKPDPVNPGNDYPDENFSQSTSFQVNQFNLKPLYFRLAGKKGKTYILSYWNLERLLMLRTSYFDSIFNGDLINEAYLEGLNKEIDRIYKSLRDLGIVLKKEIEETPDIAILRYGYFKESSKIGNKFLEPVRRLRVTQSNSNRIDNPIFVIPSGALSGRQNDSTLKYSLKNYVVNGGTILCFAQQYSEDYAPIPVPDGASLKAYGWREDSSCLKNSVYFSGMHPVLSSATNELLDAGVDGYFSVYPSESTVLLRRKVNGEPALLYYPYGQGKVILTSLFTDYAASRSMASTAELRLVRDILTFAKAKTEIPMFNLEENPTPGISLNVRLTNSTETPTAKARIKAYTPARDKILYDADVSVSLNPGQTADVPVSFTLPTVLPAQYGICHVDYELYDAQDTIAQLSTESETGMFSIYKTPTPTVNNKQIYEWITINSEIAYWGQEVECTMHFKNTSTQPRTVTADDPFFTIDHGETLIPCTPFSVTVNPGESYDHVVKLRTSAFNEGFNYNSQFTFRIQYFDNEGTLKQFGNAKTVFLKNALTKSSIAINNTGGIYPGQPLNVTIQSGSDAALSGETTIKLTLEKYNLETRTYTEVNTVYQAGHDFSTGTYNQTTAYLPETVQTSGGYRLKLDVISPNGVKEISRYTNFSIQPSGFRAGLGKLTRNGVITNTLLPGETYTVPVKLSNTMFPASNYNVQNGACILRLVSKKSNSELFRKELTNLAVAYNEQTEVTESLVFNPIETGRYALEIAYKDETRENYTRFSEAFSYFYGTYISITPDKTSYNYIDAANLNITINGIGTYTLLFSCPEAGITETRSVQIPEGSFSISELFRIPIGFSSLYTIDVAAKDAAQITTTNTTNLYVNPLFLEINGNVNVTQPFAAAGNPLEYTVKLKGISGYSQPLNGEIIVTAPGFAFQETRQVLLQPAEESTLTYSIPIPVDISTGTYPITAQFKLNGIEMKSCQTSIQVPEPNLEFSLAETETVAGETIEVNIKNTGGQPGDFDITLRLRDELGKEVLTLQETHTLQAGETKHIPLAIPAALKSGPYILLETATETKSNKSFSDTHRLTISGLTAQLQSYTLKETYTSSESIAAKSEITAGNRDLDTHTLHAQILKLEQTQSMEKIHDTVNCQAKDAQNHIWAGTETGVTTFDGTNWQDITQLPDGTPIGPVNGITSGPSNKIYALSQAGVIVFDGTSHSINMVIPYSDRDYELKTIAVDQQNRIWIPFSGEVRGVTYYTFGQGQWNYFDAQYYSAPNHILSDQTGGVWLIYDNRLTHVTPTLSIQTWTTSDGLPGDILTAHVGADAKLWIITRETYKLYSFNGSTWTDYSNKEGYPAFGMTCVTNDETGKIYGIAVKSYMTNIALTLENNSFIEMGQEFMAITSGETPQAIAIDGNLYTNGRTGAIGEGETGETLSGLLKISNSSGTGNTILWEHTVNPVHVTANSTTTIDLETNQSLEPGFYMLQTELLTPTTQLLAQSAKPFTVINTETDISLSIAAGETYSPTGTLKTGTDLPITVNILNNTPQPQPGLTLTITKTSPSGTTETLHSESLDLNPNQSETRIITFNETETGLWEVEARGTFFEKTVPLDPLKKLLVKVVNPIVDMQIDAPAYAADEPVTVKILLQNPGEIPVNIAIHSMESETQTTLLHETLTLNPREHQLLTFTDTITSDKTYTFEVTGDLETSQTKTIQYAYKESVALDAQPIYREGIVTIPYTIANTGGLPFSETLHAELFPIGSTTPQATLEKNHNLYPDQPPITGTLEFALAPGSYELKTKTTRLEETTTTFSVQPSGIGTIGIPTGTIAPIPIGPAQIAFAITNTDTQTGPIPVLITLNKIDPQTGTNGENLISETRVYTPAPGETLSDTLHVEILEAGDYALSFSGTKLSAPVSIPIRVVNLEEVNATLTLSEPQEPDFGIIPIQVTLENTGIREFTGTAIIEVDGILHEEPVIVASGSTFNGTIGMNTAALTPGSKEVKAILYDGIGTIVTQTSKTILLKEASIVITQVPSDLTITAGSYAEVNLTLKNQGHFRGEAVLKLRAFDTLNQERPIALEPGQEITLGSETGAILIEVPGDLPSGTYPFYYTLSGPGVENKIQSGNFSFTVNGLALQVEAALDRTLYNPGETATLTISVSSKTGGTEPSAVPLEAIVNWGEFSETRAFTLGTGGTDLIFNIPLDEARQEKVFYGIYHEGGKGIHLNDIYLTFRGDIDVELDKQVYAPGEIVHAVFSGDRAGVLTVSAFDESYTLNLSSTVSAEFQVPQEALGGTYGVSWDFVPTDVTQTGHSGSQPFDVSGLVVKTAKSELERGKYQPGETIKAHYLFESNRDQVLEMRSWVSTPSGDWTYLGENNVTVSANRQIDASTAYSFNTTEAGTHELIYGLYNLTGDSEQLVVSGRNSFVVGDAVLLGVTSDRSEYKTGSEAVRLRIDYFGRGTAQLNVLLDDESQGRQAITLDGIGSSEVIIDSARLSGGSHTVQVVLTQNGLTSVKSTGFVYGTDLPDLAISIVETERNGLEYTYKLEAVNNGKTASGATTVSFMDNGITLGTVSVPSLQPSQPSSSEVFAFAWNGTGKAGTHEMVFEIDPGNAVKEYSETNNRMVFNEEVPVLFFDLVVDPFHYPAQTAINIVTRLVNNQETPIQPLLELSIINETTGAIVYSLTQEEQLSGFASKDLGETFDTALNPAGTYTIRQSLTGTGEALSREVSIYIEPTPVITAALQLEPQQIAANTPSDVQLTMALKNSGNIDLEQEALKIEIFNTDSGTVVQSEEMEVSALLGEEITLDKTLSLNLAEGNYEVWLKQEAEIIALAELTLMSSLKPSTSVTVNPHVLLIMPPAARGAFFEKTAPLDPPQKLLIKSSWLYVQFLVSVLQSRSIPYETAFGPIETFIKFHKGQTNINIISGNEMNNNFRTELQERVFHGEGLILLCDKPAQNPEYMDFLGVKIKPVTGKQKETTIQLLQSEFSTAAEFELKERVQLQLEKISEVSKVNDVNDDVVIIAQTKQHKIPVMAYRKYGKGHILVIAVPLELASGTEIVAQMLLKAIELFNTDIYSTTPLTRLLPIETAIKNDSTEEKQVIVKQVLPYGVEGFDYQPEPSKGNETSDENGNETVGDIQWKLTIPAASSSVISSWLKLPDRVNTYTIKTELWESERLLAEEVLSFDVTATVQSALNELILELQSLEAGGKDAQNLRKAVRYLEQVRARPGNALMDHLLNLHDTVAAASYIGEVRNLDVAVRRFRCEEIMVVMGLRLYEAVKTVGENLLAPLLGQM